LIVEFSKERYLPAIAPGPVAFDVPIAQACIAPAEIDVDGRSNRNYHVGHERGKQNAINSHAGKAHATPNHHMKSVPQSAPQRTPQHAPQRTPQHAPQRAIKVQCTISAIQRAMQRNAQCNAQSNAECNAERNATRNTMQRAMQRNARCNIECREECERTHCNRNAIAMQGGMRCAI
jgi:hypothetical protein